ncbi:helix-turn-helix domain-containing protein [Paenibacillus sp. M.A.Huq-84]
MGETDGATMLKGRFFRNSLILILLISSIPGFIIGFIVYWMGGERLENEMLQLHKNQILQRAANIDDQFSYIEQSLAHWAFDPKFNSSLLTTNFFKDFEVARDVTKTLGVMQGSTPLARQAELFVNGVKPIRFSPEYDVIQSSILMNSYSQMLASGQLAFWISLDTDPAQDGVKDLTLVHKLPGVDFEPFGALLVRINADKVSSLLKTLTPYNVGETFIMETSGNVLVTSTGVSKEALFDEALRNEVLHRDSRSGSFLYEWKKTTYTVSYGAFSRIGTDWIYVSASPINAITKPVVIISRLILFVSGSALLLAFLLSWLASRRIYSPIDRLVRLLAANKLFAGNMNEQNDEFKMIEKEWLHLSRESTTLQNRLEQQLPHVKEGFLLQLVQGFLYSYSEEDLKERMRNLDWMVDERLFLVMHIQLTGFENLTGRFSQGDEGLITFAAANMIEELAVNRWEQANVINFHDLSVGLLIMVPADQSYRMELHAFSDELMQAINHILKLQVSVTIGKAAYSVVQIPLCYEEAKQALSYRNFENENQMIDLEMLEVVEESDELRYPFVLEREIIQLIRTGRQQEAETTIAAFLEALRERGAKEIDIQQSMLQLLGSILHAIRHSGMDPNRVYKSVNLYEQLTQIREPQKMIKWFNGKVIQPFVMELEARSDVQIKKVIESAMIYLQNQYMNDISLDSCADHTGLNPVALSKTFKQVTGKNFIDYLTELRMGKAKELLVDTELKINDVAVQVGYQHSYFNRIFKKQEGITPSQYREMARKI